MWDYNDGLANVLNCPGKFIKFSWVDTVSKEIIQNPFKLIIPYISVEFSDNGKIFGIYKHEYDIGDNKDCFQIPQNNKECSNFITYIDKIIDNRIYWSVLWHPNPINSGFLRMKVVCNEKNIYSKSIESEKIFTDGKKIINL